MIADRRLQAVAVVMALLAALTGCGSPTTAVSSVDGWRGLELIERYPMPEAQLLDVEGRAYGLRHTSTRPVKLVFFGYTNCPDVCTGIVTDVASALNRLSPAERAKVDVLIITTDPARDTGPALKAYLDRIDPSFVGLTGSLSVIVQVADHLGVGIQKASPLPSGGYEVTHGAQVLGFGPDQTARVMWRPGTAVGDFRHDIAKLIAQVG